MWMAPLEECLCGHWDMDYRINSSSSILYAKCPTPGCGYLARTVPQEICAPVGWNIPVEGNPKNSIYSLAINSMSTLVTPRDVEKVTLDRLEEVVYHLTLNLSSMTTQTLKMTTKTLEMTAKLYIILDRLSALIPTPSPPKPPPTIAPTSAPPPLVVSHHLELKTIAPMALLTLLQFHSTNRHIQLSRSLPLSLCTAHHPYRHCHCREIPYNNDIILLSDAAVEHQIHPHSIWILYAVKTRL
ncbi:hypothetical protein HKD37_01G002474 [Glycine soja]